MKLIDISRPLPEAPKYPTAPETVFSPVSRIEAGDESNFCHLFTNTHAGTHADAFRHFVAGACGIGEMPLSLYYGPIRVLSVPERTLLTPAHFEGRLSGAERLALHGGGFSYLTPEAAELLVRAGIRCLVTDAWSPAPLDNEKQIHQLLLKAQVAIVENVTLEHVPDGDYQLIAFPANFGRADGAPVRAVLLQED